MKAKYAAKGLHYSLPTQDRKNRLLYVIETWNRWSLDAPTVALVWRFFLARDAGVSLPQFAPVLLALGTWIVYVADRLLDGMGKVQEEELRERHYFYARHRVTFGVLLSCAVLWLLVLVVEKMQRDILEAYVVLGLLVLLYFFLIHGKRRSAEQWLPKELFVGFIFAAVTALPIWMRVRERSRELEIGIVLFAVACWLNCVAIEWWENAGTGGVVEKKWHAHISTRWLGRHLAGTSLILASVGFVCWLLWASPYRNVALACCISGILFSVLDVFRVQIGARWLRIAADVSLLTPVLLMPWMPAQ